jgi:Protein of unknown function (DUF1236)
MTNRFLISTAVAALIAGTGFANAQGTGVSREAPAAGSTVQPAAPSAGGAASGTINHDATAPASPKAAQSEKTPAAGKNQHAEENMPGQKSKSMSSETETKGAKDMKAEGKSGAMDSKSASDNKAATDTKSGNMNAQTKSPADTKGGNLNAETKPAADSKSGNMNAQTKSPTDAKSQTTTGNAATTATAAPPAEKQTQIVSAIKTEKIQETTNVNFNISVGATIPGTVRFHPLPPRIVEIYPEWRGYDVIFVRGQYIIVRPQTHEIVYIIEG